MATIPQLNLFSWDKIDVQSDLRRLEFVLEALPDERLMQKLERQRGGGRNDYPVRAVWNSLIASVVFEHNSFESLRRELRQVCGFDLHLGSAAVPTARAYSSFLKALFNCTDEIEAMFDQLVQKLTQLLPDFGECLAVDSKAISSFSTRKNKHTKPDGRRDLDADWGRKDYKGVGKNSKSWKKIIEWFGYKLHLVVDSTYELPVAFDLTRASKSDQKNLLPLIEKIKQTHPQLVERAEHLTRISHQPGFAQVQGARFEAVSRYCEGLATK
jgi:Transposase DDE domain